MSKSETNSNPQTRKLKPSMRVLIV